MALQMEPNKKLKDVIKAILSGLKYLFSFDPAGISLIAYMIKSPIDVIVAYLKIVPYYVTKKPSEPSRITSAISCIPLGPQSFLRISQSIHNATPKKTMENMNAVKVIMLDVDYDTKM